MITSEINGNGTVSSNDTSHTNHPINGNGTNSTTPGSTLSPSSIGDLSQSDREEILSMIGQIREKLPFLQDLTAEQRRILTGMGNSNRAFAGKVLEVASQNADFLPRSFNVHQLRADLDTFDRLSSIAMSLTQLCNLVDATLIAIGTQAYEQSLVAYRHAKASDRGASLDAMKAEMSQRFTKKSRKKTSHPIAAVPSEED